MKDPSNFLARQQHTFILILLVIVGGLFFMVVKNFIVPVLFAALIVALFRNNYKKTLAKLGGRRVLASILSTFLFLLMIVIPAFFLLVLVINEAGTVSKELAPTLQQQFSNNGELSTTLTELFPFPDQLEPYREEVYERIREAISTLGNTVVKSLGSITQGTLILFLNLFILLYSMFFFFLRGEEIMSHC